MSKVEEFRKRRNEIGTRYGQPIEKEEDVMRVFAKYFGAVLGLLFDELETLIELCEKHTPTKEESND